MMKAGDTPKKNREISMKLYTLEVYLTDGPMTEAHIAENPVVCRTIQVRGDQTLEDLHVAIFKAFDRWENHMYQFQVGGRGPWDPRARRFEDCVPAHDPPEGMEKVEGAQTTRLDDLKLKAGQPFGYWFDFGDDWRHQINAAKIGRPVPRARYPKVIKHLGASPPQYMELEEEDE